MTHQDLSNPHTIQTIETVRFNGSVIPVATIDGTPYVAIKPICKTLGLNWSGQRQRIQRDPVLSRSMVITAMETGGTGTSRGECITHSPPLDANNEMLFIPVKFFNGWLFGIDTRRVRPERRDVVIKYQEQCYDALFAHFFGKQLAAAPAPLKDRRASRPVEKREPLPALPAPEPGPQSLSIDEALALLDPPYAWMCNISISARTMPLIRALIVVLRARLRHAEQAASAVLGATCDTSNLRVTRNDIGRNS